MSEKESGVFIDFDNITKSFSNKVLEWWLKQSKKERLQIIFFSFFLKIPFQEHVIDCMLECERNKQKLIKLNSKCRMCDSKDNSVEYGEYYLICQKCKNNIKDAWRYNYTHYKQVPWNIRNWLDEERN